MKRLATKPDYQALARFAANLSRETRIEDIEDEARKRGWVDADGALTPAGLEVVNALNGQDQTRSVFRNT